MSLFGSLFKKVDAADTHNSELVRLWKDTLAPAFATAARETAAAEKQMDAEMRKILEEQSLAPLSDQPKKPVPVEEGYSWDWVEAYRDAERTVFVDSNTIQRGTDGLVLATHMYNLVTPLVCSNQDVIGSYIVLNEYDFSNRTVRCLYNSGHTKTDGQGEMLYERDMRDGLPEPAEPGTVREAVLDFVFDFSTQPR